ncbi:MAG: hypothetical protein J6A75_02255 [Lachnospiraceae bacterium]|nr:hypothetical protein [Lachnospiraceae bacterium]
MTDSEKLDLLLNKVCSLENRFDGLENRFDGLENRFDGLENRFDGLENEVGELKNDVKKVKVVLENEIRVNIQRVAEGHLDLSRNLHEAMKPSNEVEMLAIKVRMLESDMLELKRKIS